ncbi:MAG: LysM peptidoglycan-binding domain-containing protein [Desulfobulbaceae bacterium]|uniref:LysM peptidoglycan-binding domain-containing protein n=1 Tax=Candidatus Desulfobia pelagia TaxID=2841692 RepID=A0A8J6TGT2_9BACT|nr:LysM peptidoglycan-binding domain-containing protein [Candidatus Desulfobia pelagia]
MLNKNYNYHTSLLIFSLVLLTSLWGCASSEHRTTQSGSSLSTKPLSALHTPEDHTPELETVLEELTVPEPEITVAEEVEKLGNLGTWEEGTPEKILTKPEITYDFPVTMNKQVEFYLDFFQNKQRSTFTRWLERSGRYLPMMKEHLKQAGLPLDLVYLPMIESGYSLTAYSSAHAAGPWQFIRSTGKMYGLEINSYIDERRNPVKATQSAISFLSDLYDQFGDWHLAVAAYNAGGRKISRGLKRYNTDNFWELAQEPYLALETKRYVPKLIAAILIAKDPEKYGFVDINYASPMAYETLEVPRWTSLRAVAVACDSDLKEIQDLNRELRKLITPPDNASYALKVPAGKKDLAAINLPKVHTSINTSYQTHIVQKNETLTMICRKYNLNKTTLLKANNLRKSKLEIGQRLRIPYQTTTYALWDKEAPRHAGSGSSHLILHKVKPGETVSLIAHRYNVPVHLIAGWNDLQNIHTIKAGQQIALYLADSNGAVSTLAQTRTSPTERTASAPRHYDVRPGDSLWSIGRRFNVDPATIRLWNNIKDNLIHPGTRLLLTDPEAIGPISMADKNSLH